MAQQTVLITGCSAGGIGSALAEAFHGRGLYVFATARDLSKMSHLEGVSGITLLELDVTNTSHICDTVASVKPAANGKLDYLVNNSGRNFFMPTLDIDIDDAKGMFETNLWAPIAIMQAFTPLIIEAKGTIINICSISGHLNVPWMGIYAASKRSLEVVSETMRLEMAPFGVKVVSVSTGAVQSQGQTYFENFQLPESSIYKPIEKTIAARAQGQDGVP